ncbi:hypothetical protein J2Z79_002020 [Symbiobacterium terraclitae]|uniref:Uncharacterized protein n=1 Tax=Symbiobacterium terraclitae TaxID=557451 RepID=A0ABS4JSW1_9FIRM|nr:hypothetical protein [Symbiobacterium terraclitae]MBP2018605.1 hypothetical protein [Symbiobacterium terraclitae]
MARWLLLAAGPAALALGLIVGVAISAYGPAQPAPGPGAQAEPQTDTQQPGSPGGPAGTETVQPGLTTTPEPASVADSESAPLLPPPVDDSAYATPAIPPAGSLSAAEVKTLVDARAVLTAEFSTFRTAGAAPFTVDYQLARDINYDTMLVGIVKLAEYNNWLSAVRDHGDELQRWLTAAARRVRSAAEAEGFGLSWAIFEFVPDRPYGFMASEVTATPNGRGYLVTRPLAAVTDFSGPTVTIAALPGTGPVTAPDPTAVYGPVLRFDPTDLYRPRAATP